MGNSLAPPGSRLMDHGTQRPWVQYGVNLVMIVLLAGGGFLAGRLSVRADRLEAGANLADLKEDLERTLEIQEKYRLQVEWRKMQAENGEPFP